MVKTAIYKFIAKISSLEHQPRPFNVRILNPTLEQRPQMSLI